MTKVKELPLRSKLVKEFVDTLNEERGEKFKPLDPKFVAVRMGHLDTWDLAIFLGMCKERNFSKFWWWALKPQEK